MPDSNRPHADLLDEFGLLPADLQALPTVTVFGAGVAGLTAAHELIERGFDVQVVESAESQFEEYECEVGGLAANQFSRVPASTNEVHGSRQSTYSPDENTLLRNLRQTTLSEAAPRFPITQRIMFSRANHEPPPAGLVNPPLGIADMEYHPTALEPTITIPGDWTQYWDMHGEFNSSKLNTVLDTFSDAYEYYLREYTANLSGLANFTASELDAHIKSDLAISEILSVRIVGYTDTDGTAEGNREISRHWARQVRTELLALNASRAAHKSIPDLDKRLEIVARGSADPKFDQSTAVGRRLSNRVEFEIVEQLIPGEHGFRFFPSFYRHLFDTMRRTPLLDRKGFATGRTAYDHLVPTPGAMLALNDGDAPIQINLREITSLRQITDALEVFVDRLQLKPKDLLGLQFFTARYMTSCSMRRQKEGEPRNFIEYIGGRNSYSQEAFDFVNNAPRALAAMSATESDARTQFNIVVQLMGLAPDQKNVADMTLNGPTDTAWLDHWKRYLKVQGVRFFVGSLHSIKLDGATQSFIPEVRGPRGKDRPQPEDPYDSYQMPADGGDDLHRFVVALPLQAASDLISDAYQNAMAQNVAFEGPFRQLVEFDRASGRRRVDGTLVEPQRNPSTGATLGDYPLRTISGLQYFFSNNYRIGTGNLYFPDSPWGLTSISQLAYWQDQIKPVGQFLGQISVDVGDWHNYYPDGATQPLTLSGQPLRERGHPAWHSSTSEIAVKTWLQIKDGLETSLSQALASPGYYHIDKNIVRFETQYEGFQGNLVVRALQLMSDAQVSESSLLEFRLSLQTHIGDWSRYQGSKTRTKSVETDYLILPDPVKVAIDLAKQINEPIDGEFVTLAVIPPEPTEEDNSQQQSQAAQTGEIIISPYTFGGEFWIWARTTSTNPKYIAIDGNVSQIIIDIPDEDGFYEPDILRFEPDLSDNVRIENVEIYDGQQSIRLKLTLGSDSYLSVANRDGLIEVLGGAQLRMETASANIRMVTPPSDGSGFEINTAVRSNGIIEFGKSQKSTFDHPEPGRVYGLQFSIQDRSGRLEFQASPNDEWPDVHQDFIDRLKSEHDSVVLARSMDYQALSGEERFGIVLSPVVEISSVMISLAPEGIGIQPSGEFIVLVNDCEISVSGDGRTRTEVRDAILDEIHTCIANGEITTAANHSLSAVSAGETRILLSLDPVDEPEVPAFFRISVLHRLRMIELVGAPQLVISTKDIAFDLTKIAFVPFRNDAEFLINRPNQWQFRPGLFDGLQPGDDPDPHSGSMDGEIFYAHSQCPPLRNWVAAGTYMATKTRMTTMEAAAESARHAVTGIIHQLIVTPAGGGQTSRNILPSSLPEIWDPEQHEPADLEFWKEVDDELCKLDLPHVFDILNLTDLVLFILQNRDQSDEMAGPIGDSRADILRGLALLTRGTTSSRSALRSSLSRSMNQLRSTIGRQRASEIEDELAELISTIFPGHLP